MKSFKQKIIVVFVILSVSVLGLAAYSWVSYTRISDRVELITQPDQKSALLRDMTTNLSLLTNLYLKRGSVDANNEAHRALLAAVDSSLNTIRSLYRAQALPMPEALETIPALIDSIRIDSDGIIALRQTYEADFKGRLESEIMHAIATAELTDSILVESRSQREVVRIVEKELLAEITEEESVNRNFFQKLFSKTERDTQEASESKAQSTPGASAKYKDVSIDTVEYNGTNITKIVDNKVGVFQREVSKILKNEREIVKQIEDKENALYETNLELIAKLDMAVNEFRRERQETLIDGTQTTLQTTQRFNRTLTFIVLGFGLASLVMLWMLFRDIEKNRYYQELLKKNESLALQRAEDKQRFLNTMSHELRTPLTAIIGYTELINEEDNPHVKAIQASSKYLMNIANDILDIAKIEAGKIDIHLAPTDMGALIDDLRVKFEPLIKKAGLEARFSIPDTPLVVMTDAVRIEQVLYNLLHNAVKFTAQGYVGVRLRSEELGKEEVKVQIDVMDSGIGIHAAELENIFNDYHQAGTHKENAQGTGLGLGIVKKIMHHLGGNISVKSQKDVGSNFIINFACELCSSVDVNKSDNTISAPMPLEGKKICVVDDDPFIAKLYQIILSKYGGQIIPFMESTEALNYLKISTPDILITDLKMPVMGGKELVENLVKEGRRPKVVIAASAHMHVGIDASAMHAVFDKVMLKPFTQEKLVATLTEALNGNGNHSAVDTGCNGLQENHSTEQAYNHDGLARIAKDNKAELYSMLTGLYTSNFVEIGELSAALGRRDLSVAADRIHKLMGRFDQIQAKTGIDARLVEERLRKENTEALAEADDLCAAWTVINVQLGKALMDNNK